MPINSSDQRQLERTRYWQGQMFQSRDLQGQVATDLQLRWWHNRALHQAYGVALGYEATPLREGFLLHGFEFAPGVAYDCFGRALVLLRNQKVLLPDNPQRLPLTLVVRYSETADFPDPRLTDGACPTCCEDSMAEEHPEFVWTLADPPSPAMGVPLARVIYNEKTHLAEVNTSFVLMTTEPLARPYLATGATLPGSTPWKLWSAADRIIGLETIVDTSSAGFSQTPCYFAWLANLDPVALDLVGVAIFTHIAQVKPDKFHFRIIIGGQASDTYTIAIRRLGPLLLPFNVCWLGCQSLASTTQCLNPEVAKSCCG